MRLFAASWNGGWTAILAVALLSVGPGIAQAANCASKQSGSWSASGTWKSCGGGIPQGGDTVTITDAVTLNANTANLASLTVGSGASLSDDGVATRRLQLSGALSNAGTINLYTNSSQPSYIQLQTDSTWSGNGSITADYLDLSWHALTLTVGDTMTIALKNATPLQNSSAFNGGSPANSTATLYLNRSGAQTIIPWTGTFPNIRIGGSGTKSAWAATLNILGSLTIDNGATLDFGSTYVTVNIKGDVSNSGTFGPGLGTWTFNGTAAQTVSSAATFQTLVLNNSAGLTLGGDLTLGTWGTVNLQAGRIVTGSNKVVVAHTCSGWLTRASGTWINGNLSLMAPNSGGTCVFDVGDATNYAPITFTFPWHSAPLGGAVLASTSAGDHADTTAGTSGISATKSVNRTWALTQSSGTFYTYDATFQFCNGTSTDCGVSDVDAGATTGSFMVVEKSGGTWSQPTTSTLTSTSSKATGMTTFGTFAVGEATPAAAFAYYAMDETTWNGTAGEVVDSSGNNRHGRAVGSASAVSGGYVCRGGNIPSNTSDGTQSAVDTGLDVDSTIGSKGTIAFWYKSKANWNGGGDRTLLDASSSSSDKYFSLLLDSSGRLVFALEDSGDEDIVVQTSQYSYTSSDWVHIAVTWDMPGDRREIYVNGSLATTNTDNRGSALGNIETLYIGDNRSSYHPDGSPNSANGVIDEVYIYNSKLAKAQIQAAMNASHTCPPGTTTCTTFRDEFASTSYSLNAGTANWTGNWIETGDDNSASGGTVRVTGNRLRFAGSGSGGSATFGGPSLEREANLSGASVATLTFDYSQTTNWENSDIFEVWVSKDGGSNWTKIHSIVNDSGSTATQSFSYDVSAYVASNFRVAFAERMNSSTEYFYVDNVQVEACSANIDHVRIEHSGAGVTCVREPVTIKACKDADCTAQYTAGSVSLTLAPSGGWYSAASGGAASDALGFTGSATRYFERTAIGTYVLDASSVSPTPANGVKCYVGATQTCNLSFSDAGFVVAATANGGEATTIDAHTAGTGSATYYLRAVKADKSTKACEAALTGANNVNFAYECLNPAACYGADLMSINGGTATTVARNDSGSVSSFTPVAMTFDANGNAPFTFNYSDVGQVRLHMVKAAGGSLMTALSGSMSAFIVKPSGFVISGVQQTASPNTANPAAADASGAVFVKAGEAFTATVTAKAGSGTAYSFGREATAEEVTLAHALVAPSGGAAGTLASATIAGGSFTNGVATVDTFAWSEVGIITLTPSNGDYLDAGAVVGTTSGNIGRFYPDRFDTEVTNACAAGAGAFTYSGQPFTARATARAAGGGTTTNYTGDFAKTVTLTDGGAGTVPCTANCNIANARFAGGVATLDAASTVQPTFTFAAKLTAPSVLTLRATESAGGDDVTSNVVGPSEGTTALRSGRLRLSNVFGSERTALQMPMQAQYWSGNSWVINELDNCTAPAAGAFAVSGLTNVTGIGVISSGNWTVNLAAPGVGTVGAVDIAANLGTGASDVSCLPTPPARPVTVGAALPWLRSRNGNCVVSDNFAADPSARATFGIYSPESRRTVHVREGF